MLGIKNPGSRSWVLLVLSLVLAFANNVIALGLSGWGDVLQFGNFFSMIAVLVSVAIAWLGESPIGP